MTDTIIGAFIGVGGAIIGAIIAGPIAYFFSRKLIRESHKNDIEIIKLTEFNKTAAKFRAAFIEEYRFLNRECAYDRIGIDIPDILSAATEKHERAFMVFKTILPCEDQIGIQKAWENYTGKKYHLGKYTFRQYTTKGNLKNGEKIRNTALKNINVLLQFAELKH